MQVLQRVHLCLKGYEPGEQLATEVHKQVDIIEVYYANSTG